MTKKIYVDHCTSTEGTCVSPPIRKMCPILNLPLIGENMIIFANKTFQVVIFEKIHITGSDFVVHIWNHGKNSQDLRVQNTCTSKMLDWCNITFRHLS